ncbi:MAG: hypothetical protein PQ964_01755 [Methanobacteriaceae archaeon]|jgi:hypothetical protein
MVDKEDREFTVLRLVQLRPQEYKTILVKAKKQFKGNSFIKLSVSNFNFEPGKIFYL